MDERTYANCGAVDQLAIEIEAGAMMNLPECEHVLVRYGDDGSGDRGDQIDDKPVARCPECGVSPRAVFNVVYSSDFSKAG